GGPRSVFPVRLPPLVDLGEGLCAEPVPALPPVGPNFDEAGFAQHTQVLRDTGLAEVQRTDEFAHGALAAPQQVEDLTARRLGEGGVRSHAHILLLGYMSCWQRDGRGVPRLARAVLPGVVSNDPQSVEALFTPAAVYWTGPFAEPRVGVEDIVAAWIGGPRE